MTGYSHSTNFPTTPGAFRTFHTGLYDAFVTKLDEWGSSAHYSTYVGGDANEVAQGVTEVLAYGTAVVVEAVPRS